MWKITIPLILTLHSGLLFLTLFNISVSVNGVNQSREDGSTNLPKNQTAPDYEQGQSKLLDPFCLDSTGLWLRTWNPCMMYAWFNFVFGILEQSIDLSERHSQVWCVWSYIYPMFVAEMSTRQWVLSSITNWTCLCSRQGATARCLLPLPATWMSFFQQYLD